MYVITEKAFSHLNALGRKLSWLLAAVRNKFKAMKEVVLVLLAVSRVSTVSAYNLGKFDESP